MNDHNYDHDDHASISSIEPWSWWSWWSNIIWGVLVKVDWPVEAVMALSCTHIVIVIVVAIIVIIVIVIIVTIVIAISIIVIIFITNYIFISITVVNIIVINIMLTFWGSLKLPSYTASCALGWFGLGEKGTQLDWGEGNPAAIKIEAAW